MTYKMTFWIKYKCYIIIELTFLEGLILVKKANQNNVIFITIGVF